jgi:Protein of unknown function (DUF4056)
MNDFNNNYELLPEFDVLFRNQSQRNSRIINQSISSEIPVQRKEETDMINKAIESGEKIVERLTDTIFFKRHPALVNKNISEQSDFKKLRQEWINICETLVKPLLLKACKIKTAASATPVTVTPRPCCMLSPDLDITITTINNFLEPGSLGSHAFKSALDADISGILYTGRAGFVDLGHLRETCDITKSVFDQLISTAGVPSIVSSKNGTATIKNCTSDLLTLAQAITYDEAKGHELVSFWQMSVGGHNSSFSPEDLCSNFLGTVVARRAIIKGGNFNSTVTAEIDKLLTDLDVQTVAESLNSFNRIKNRWVNYTDSGSFKDIRYLKRRNFSFIPWQTGHKADKAIPLFITGFLPDLSTVYDFSYSEGGVTVNKKDWGKEIARIKTEARRVYGSRFDKNI